jgi:hypothetical protein
MQGFSVKEVDVLKRHMFAVMILIQAIRILNGLKLLRRQVFGARMTRDLPRAGRKDAVIPRSISSSCDRIVGTV